MTEKPPLDLALVLAKLHHAYHRCDPEYPLQRLIGEDICAAIALIEPHVPKPPDPWMEALDRMIDNYAFAVLSDSDSIVERRRIIRNYVAAERARLRGQRER